MTIAYLATPYTRYKPGIEAAYREACAVAGRLILAGAHIFSPIAHTHGIAIHGGIDPLDEKFWREFDEKMLALCDTLIVVHMPGWDESRGIAQEVSVFERAGKPIFDLTDIVSLSMKRRG